MQVFMARHGKRVSGRDPRRPSSSAMGPPCDWAQRRGVKLRNFDRGTAADAAAIGDQLLSSRRGSAVHLISGRLLGTDHDRHFPTRKALHRPCGCCCRCCGNSERSASDTARQGAVCNAHASVMARRHLSSGFGGGDHEPLPADESCRWGLALFGEVGRRTRTAGERLTRDGRSKLGAASGSKPAWLLRWPSRHVGSPVVTALLRFSQLS